MWGRRTDRMYTSAEVTRRNCSGISFQFIRVAMTLKSKGPTGSSDRLSVVVPREADLLKTYLVFIRASIPRAATGSSFSYVTDSVTTARDTMISQEPGF